MIVSPCKSNPPARLEAVPASRFPLLARRGGRDIKKISRSSFDGADGVVVQRATTPSLARRSLRVFSLVPETPLLARGDTPQSVFGGVLGPFMVSLFLARSNVRRFFMLPLSRRELVAKAGATLLLVGLRIWLAGSLAFGIAHWRIPPAELLLTTLAFQLPLFGILTLVMSVRRPWRSARLLILTPAVAFGLLGVWILVAPVQVRLAVFLTSGVALIGLSYYRWCNAELE
jgi:hypothetical protein